MLGLYVHVPFCSAICNYCNFTRGLFDADLKTGYVAALLQEIRRTAQPLGADTLYFGGGTPSLLDPAEIAQIIEACRTSWRLAGDAEITLEANPETVDRSKLREFHGSGINRLSFGVQSLRDEELRRLDRLHSAARAVESVEAARAAGFENLSIDLMMWLPQQKVSDWMQSVEGAIAVDPDHISLYMLEVYPHLPLRQQMTENAWDQLPDDEVAEMYEQGLSRFAEAGYEQYEISNVSRPGRESRHNLKYWTDGEWVGFGPGAHSTQAGRRWRNVSATGDYIDRLRAGSSVIAECRTLDAEERLGDALFTGLRLRHGINLSNLSQRYGADVWGRYGARLSEFVAAGLLMKEGERLWLTRNGMLLANEVMAVFV